MDMMSASSELPPEPEVGSSLPETSPPETGFKKLSQQTGWADSDTKAKFLGVAVATILMVFVISTLERPWGPSVDSITEQVKEQVAPALEDLVIQASTEGSDLVSSAKYTIDEFDGHWIILGLKVPTVPATCWGKPLMVWLKRPDSLVIGAWRPKITKGFPLVSLPTPALDPGLYDVDVQACGGSFPPSEGRTTLRIP